MIQWFKGIRGRLLAVALLPIMGFTIASVIAFSGISKVNGLLLSAHKEIIPKVESVNHMNTARNKMGYHIWAAIASLDNVKVKKERISLAREALSEWRAALDVYESLNNSSEEAAKLSVIDKYKTRYIELLNQVFVDLESEHPKLWQEAKDLMLGEIWKVGGEITQNNQALLKMNESRSLAEREESLKTKEQVYQNTIIANTTMSLVILVIMIWISSRMVNVISGISSKLSDSSSHVAGSIQQLNQSGDSLSHSATEAAASLQQTVASLEELTSMVQINADHAREAAALSATSKEAAEQGEKAIRRLIESMGEISQSSKKIEEIISVIDDIAFQTNLLALNAAVEAARAGEQGKGFAVVAEAVRTLAQRSAVAAKDITELIKDSVAQIDKGGQTADQSGEFLAKIVESVKKVSDLNNEIAAASVEQSSGIQQISKAMNQLDQASQGNAASAEEISATSAEINQMAVATQNLTSELKTLVVGEAS